MLDAGKLITKSDIVNVEFGPLVMGPGNSFLNIVCIVIAANKSNCLANLTIFYVQERIGHLNRGCRQKKHLNVKWDPPPPPPPPLI